MYQQNSIGLSVPATSKNALIARPCKGGYVLICTFTGEPFGGIFTESEAQGLVIWAGERSQSVAPAEFGAAAAQVVQGVAL